ALGDLTRGAKQRFARYEGFVALHVHHDVEVRRIASVQNRARGAFRPGVVLGCLEGLRSEFVHGCENLVTVRGNDDPVEYAELADPLPYADHERKTSEESKGFWGEARRAQSGWDDGERPHAWRPASGNAPTAEKITF